MNNLASIIENFDWTPILMIGYYVIDYSTKRIITKQPQIKYKLNKNLDYKKVELPEELKKSYKSINFKKILNLEFGQIIAKFAQVIIDNFSSKDLINFYNNINELTIINKSKIDKKKLFHEIIIRLKKKYYSTASYHPIEKTISVLEEDQMSCLPHELFHMSSSVYDDANSTVYCGFHKVIINELISMGKGLNEGYTEYMVEKYYGTKYTQATDPNYQVVRLIAKQIEQVIGRKKMESLYLNANLDGLIDELSVYVGYEETLKFIECTDYLFKNINSSSKTEEEEDELEEHIQYITHFIVLLVTKNAVKKYENREISKEDIISNIYQNILFIPAIETEDKKYERLSDSEIRNIIESIILEHKIAINDYKSFEKIEFMHEPETIFRFRTVVNNYARQEKINFIEKTEKGNEDDILKPKTK